MSKSNENQIQPKPLEDIYIELRQKKSTNVQGNGDFITKLSKPLKLQTGDSLVLSKTFLDTTISSNVENVIIEEDITLVFSAYLYGFNWSSTHKTITGDTGGLIEGGNYIFSHFKSSGSYTGYKRLTLQSAEYDPQPGKGFSWGGMLIRYSFININNEPDTATYQMPTSTPQQFIKTITDLIYKDGTLKCINTTKEFQDAQVDQANFDELRTSIDVSGQDVYTAVPRTMEFTIEKGTYDPDDLTTRINAKLTRNLSDTFTTSPVDNPFLISSGDFDAPNYVHVKDETTGFQEYIFTTDNWIGTNLIELSYDNATQRFLWNYLNMPYYDTAGAIAIDYVERTPSLNPKEYFIVNKNGGLVWNNLDAFVNNPDGTPSDVRFDFWTKKLGFNLNEILVSLTHRETASGQNVPVLGIQERVNTTGGFKGIDVGVKKNGSFELVPNFTSITPTTIQNQNQVISNEIFGNTTKNSGYFLVDINAQFKTNMIMEDTISRSIAGIVNRYYELNSYTSSGEEAGISYTHFGKDLYLNALHVRILDADGKQSQELGEDNTIYLRIIKQRE